MNEINVNILRRLPPIMQFLVDAINNEGCVLVVDSEGASCAGAITIALLMYQYNMPLNNAHALLKLKRIAAHPNSHFLI
jgi:protein-tyrosine phosphatase